MSLQFAGDRFEHRESVPSDFVSVRQDGRAAPRCRRVVIFAASLYGAGCRLSGARTRVPAPEMVNLTPSGLQRGMGREGWAPVSRMYANGDLGRCLTSTSVNCLYATNCASMCASERRRIPDSSWHLIGVEIDWEYSLCIWMLNSTFCMQSIIVAVLHLFCLSKNVQLGVGLKLWIRHGTRRSTFVVNIVIHERKWKTENRSQSVNVPDQWF